MKIIVMARSTPAHTLGGMERCLADLVAELSSRHSVTVLTTKRGGGDWCKSAAVEELGAPPARYSLRWWAASRRRLKTLVEQGSVDVVLSMSIAGWWAVAGRSVPSVAQCHGTFAMEVKSSASSRSPRELAKVPLNVLRCFRDLFAYRQFTRVVAVGPAVLESLTAAPLWLRSPRVDMIPNGVDADALGFDASARAELRMSWHVEPHHALYGFVGRMHDHKNPLFFLAVAERLASTDPSARFAMLGHGPLQGKVKHEIQSRGLADRFVHVGPLPEAETLGAYSALDAVLLPSRRFEGAPLTPLESWASGALTVTSPRMAAALPVSLPVLAVPLQPRLWAEAVSKAPRARGQGGMPDDLNLFATLSRYESLLVSLGARDPGVGGASSEDSSRTAVEPCHS